MTPLEKRLIEDMKLFGYAKRTQDTYLYAVRRVTNHFQTSPDQITNEQLREYLLWHKDNYVPNTTTIALCGIKLFYQKILKKPMPVFDLARQPRGQKLPVVLTREEVRAVLANIRVRRHRACLTLIYSCGLRISEAVGLQVPQIDSQRMLIHVKNGKGARDRYVPLPQAALDLLRRHWKTHRHRQTLDRMHCQLLPMTTVKAESEADKQNPDDQSVAATSPPCPCCGKPMRMVEYIPRSQPVSGWPNAPSVVSVNHASHRNHALSTHHRVPVTGP